MSGFAKVISVTSLNPPVTPIDGNFNVEILYELMDPALQGDAVHDARQVSIVAVLPGSSPAQHYDTIMAAVLASTVEQGFNVTENRTSLPLYCGDGVRMKTNRDVPVTGFNLTVGNNVDHLLLDPAGTLASGTITMPNKISDRQIVCISSSQAITALTLQGNGTQVVTNPITTLAAGGFAYYQYMSAQNKWYRVG